MNNPYLASIVQRKCKSTYIQIYFYTIFYWKLKKEKKHKRLLTLISIIYSVCQLLRYMSDVLCHSRVMSRP